MAQGLLIQLWSPLQFLGWFYRELKQSLVDMDNFLDILQRRPRLADGTRDLPTPTRGGSESAHKLPEAVHVSPNGSDALPTAAHVAPSSGNGANGAHGVYGVAVGEVETGERQDGGGAAGFSGRGLAVELKVGFYLQWANNCCFVCDVGNPIVDIHFFL